MADSCGAPGGVLQRLAEVKLEIVSGEVFLRGDALALLLGDAARAEGDVALARGEVEPRHRADGSMTVTSPSALLRVSARAVRTSFKTIWWKAESAMSASHSHPAP